MKSFWKSFPISLSVLLGVALFSFAPSIALASDADSIGQIPLRFESFRKAFKDQSVQATASEFERGENLGCVSVGGKQGDEKLSRGEISVAENSNGSLHLVSRFQAFDDFNAPTDSNDLVLSDSGDLKGGTDALRATLRRFGSSAERIYVIETSTANYSTGDMEPAAYTVCHASLQPNQAVSAENPQKEAAARQSWIRFNDVYTETVYLNRVDTIAPYGAVRSGWRSSDYKWEIYGVVRGALDTRTQTSTDPYGIYDDNYAFEGVGVEYKNVLPGVTAQLQVGVSEDLNSKIHRGGPDFRTGFITYHEIQYPSINAHSEIYSEWLYDSRYKNLIADANWLTIQETFKGPIGDSTKWHYTLGPEISLFASGDSQGLDYNRTAEIRAGLRYKLMEPNFSFAVQPYYAIGTRWQRPTDLPHYKDMRLLLWLYSAF